MNLRDIKLPEGAGNTAVKIGGALVGAYFLKKWYENWAGEKAKEFADGKLDTDPDAAIARGLDAAMNPSGWNWLRAVDGAHPDTIYELAEKVTDYTKVQDFYKGLNENNRNLDDDLKTKLGDQGLLKFLALATKGKTGLKKYAKVRDDIPTNKWVLTTKDANVRTNAVKSHWYNKSNVVKTVPKGKILGISTGKFAYDENDDVTYIEFYTLVTKKPGKVLFYVAKSQVEYLSNDEKLKREKSGGKIPLEVLEGLEGETATEQTQLVSRRDCIVYNEHFKPILTASKNIILGFPLMNLRTQKGEYVKFKTIQGKIRWAAVADVRIENRI